jgi:hypothetical protein
MRGAVVSLIEHTIGGTSNMALFKRGSRKGFLLRTGAAAVAIFAATGSLLWVNLASGQVKPPLASYAVKFACGEFGKRIPASAAATTEGPVVPGYYQTAINIHNPQVGPAVPFAKKAVLLYSSPNPIDEKKLGFERPRAPGKQLTAELPPDFGMLIDCQDIRKVLLPTVAAAPTFIEGYVVIEVPAVASSDDTKAPSPLDVQALYTSTGYTGAGTLISRSGIAEQVVVIQPTFVTS